MIADITSGQKNDVSQKFGLADKTAIWHSYGILVNNT